MNEFIFHLEITGRGKLKQTFLEVVGAVWHRVRFSSFCYKDCMRLLGALNFMFYACFTLNNSVNSVKTIKLVWQCIVRPNALEW